MIKAVGTAFWAMPVEVNTKTKQQLEAEESVGQSSDVSKASDSSKTEDKTVSPNDNEQTILFADPTNGNLVKIDLSKENIEKLKKHFTDENNFFERQDGALRLNGKAEAYVSGWFGDIAYKREFLKADADRDGKLSEEEYKETKNGFFGVGKDVLSFSGKKINVIDSTESIERSYVSPTEERQPEGTVKYNDDYKADSIDSELNTTIRINSDFNANITLQESYQASSKNIGLSVEKIVTRHIDEYYNDMPKKSGYFSGGGQTDEEMALLMLQSRAAQKLLAANGNESVLTAEEKEALGTELKAIKKQLASKDELNSVKDELKMKIENTQFIDVRG